MARCQTCACTLSATCALLLAGDATTVPCKQIVIALSEGAKAVLSAFDHLIRSTPVEVKETA